MEEQPAPEQMPPPSVPPVQSNEQLPLLRRIHPVAFALLALAAVFFLYQIVGGVITFIISRGSLTDMNVDLLRWSTLVGQVVFILIPTLLLTRARYPKVGEFLRLYMPDYRVVIVSTIAVFSLQQLMQGYMVLQDSIPLPSEVRQLIDKFKDVIEQTYRILVTAETPLEFLFVVITVALVPAVSEELLFRGLVQRSLEQTLGRFRAAVAGGVIFGAYHLNPFSLVPLIALGVYFGFLVYRSGNITVAISAHFFNNFIACVALYLHVDDDFIVLAPSGGWNFPILLANFALFALVFVAATYYFIELTRGQDQSQ